MDILSKFTSTVFKLKRRSIDIIVPDVVVSEKHQDTLEITEHPVETGAAVADHAYRKPSEVVMEIGFSGGGALLDFASSITASSILGLSPKEVYQNLLDLQNRREPFDVVTGKRVYKNMLIRALEVTTDQRTENVLMATVTLREVIITSTSVVQAADKANMSEGVNTSTVQNAGTKTPTPPNVSLLKSLAQNSITTVDEFLQHQFGGAQ